MRAGSLDRRITIQSRSDVADALGQPIPTWGTFAADVPAGVDVKRGREFFVSQGLQVERAALFRIRYLAGLTPGMRISYDSAIWDITSAEQLYGRNREMHIFAATGLTEG